jgi:hypothetical protein
MAGAAENHGARWQAADRIRVEGQAQRRRGERT